MDGFCRDDSWKKTALGLGILGLLVACFLMAAVIYLLMRAGALDFMKCHRKGEKPQLASLPPRDLLGADDGVVQMQ